MESNEQTGIYRKLYSYRSSSNYGKYHYTFNSPLDSIPARRYEDGNFIIRKDDLLMIEKFPDKNRSSYRT